VSDFYDRQKDIEAEGQRAAVRYAKRDALKAQKLDVEQTYTEGVCEGRAAILKDGVMMTISQVLADLNDYAWLKHCIALAKREA
jgi:hypothetical protein